MANRITYNCLKHFRSGVGSCPKCDNEKGRVMYDAQNKMNMASNMRIESDLSNDQLQSIGAGFLPTEPQPKTLRDEFAMAALTGMISTAAAPCLDGLSGIEMLTAESAYSIADAMLKAREVNK